VTTFLPAATTEMNALHGYLTRLVRLDPRACVRLQGRQQVLGVWAGPPLDVVTLRPVALAEPCGDLDVTVSAQRLLERMTTGQEPVELPPPVPGPSWAGLLPPRSGWTAVATVPAGAVHDAVRVGVDAFTRRVRVLAEADRTRGRLDTVATEIWGRPVVAGVPLRLAHAADLTGLLGRDGEVTALAAGTWLRLSCPGGSVAARAGSAGLAGSVDLFAL